MADSSGPPVKKVTIKQKLTVTMIYLRRLVKGGGSKAGSFIVTMIKNKLETPRTVWRNATPKKFTDFKH